VAEYGAGERGEIAAATTLHRAARRRLYWAFLARVTDRDSGDVSVDEDDDDQTAIEPPEFDDRATAALPRIAESRLLAASRPPPRAAVSTPVPAAAPRATVRTPVPALAPDTAVTTRVPVIAPDPTVTKVRAASPRPAGSPRAAATPRPTAVTPVPTAAPRSPAATPSPATSRLAAGDPELEPGTTLGEYRIEGKLGDGGMGVVYAAVHPLIGKRAAIKVLRAEVGRSATNVERFIDEARVVNHIGHPNIVDVFAFGETPDGRHYFVMEWLKGESLRSRMARQRLELDEICEIVKPLSRALEAAHEQGVIHRDLKPDNVFLVDVRGDVPIVKLLDFGIAKLAREGHRLERTATGAMIGTPQYMAPEQARGHAIDARVDVYALGGILFELVTGRPPFVADNAMEVIAKHLMEPAPRPSTLAVGVPPELDDLIVAMLAKDASARPALVEVSAVVERASSLERTSVHRAIRADVEPAHARPTAVAAVPGTRRGRHLALALVAAAVVVAAVIAALVAA